LSWSNPFTKPGRFRRGNLHCHSTRSDGQLSPEAICSIYANAGYDFLCLSDHFLAQFGYPMTDATPFERDGFVTVRGAELHAGRVESGEHWHMLGIGLPADFARPGQDETGPSLARRALDAGAFVVAAHPAWYALGEDEIRSLGPIHAIEAWNATVAGLNDRSDSWHVFDRLLLKGGQYTACATDDAHFTGERDDALVGWVWVKTEELSAPHIVAALKAGAYYSSTGPEIQDIVIQPSGRLLVSCSPATWVFARGIGSAVVEAKGANLTNVALETSGLDAPWCRVTVVDREGRRAWSNPIVRPM
jgi:hypothetical protein